MNETTNYPQAKAISDAIERIMQGARIKPDEDRVSWGELLTHAEDYVGEIEGGHADVGFEVEGKPLDVKIMRAVIEDFLRYLAWAD